MPEADTELAPPLAVEGVSFSYGAKPALSEVSFRLARGAFTALLGANGAGKTTLLSLITRLFDTPQGEIRIDGRRLREAGSAALAPLGVVFQEQTLDLDLSVEQNLLYFAGLRGLPRAAARARAAGVLAELGIADKRREKARRLSGGQRRRLEIARALLHEPSLLVLDEPTVGLDIPTRQALVEAMHARAREGLTILWTTHLIDEVRPGDRVIVLDGGRVLADGSVAELQTRTGTNSLEAAYHQLTGTTAGREAGA